MIERGGRRDIFLGTRECQGYVSPCAFGEGEGYYDGYGELSLGFMFHGFDYPDETGEKKLGVMFWNCTMKDGIIVFPELDDPRILHRTIREVDSKEFTIGVNLKPVNEEEE